MIIKKKALQDVPREGAHGGSGGRRMYVDHGEIANTDWQAMTYGYLPGGNAFDWHHHDDIEEIMLVLKGEGEVSDRDGTYPYSAGDLFIFPANQEHMIHNTSSDEHEYIFVRVSLRQS
jgi:quercetin dioxygenase-like cupin family protein